MNRQHLLAFVWLRWRLTVNQWRRSGRVNSVLMTVVALAAAAVAVPSFLGTFAYGVYALPNAAPVYLLYAWDGLVIGFLFFWGIGLMTDLQKSDPLALSKFLHLPVSANVAFLLNYLSSLFRLTLILFGPVMLGLALALVYTKGAAGLPVLPLLAAFLLMVTALTYQFQGWLASLIGNPRRRRTLVVAATAAFVLVFQLPQLLNVYAPRLARRQAARSEAHSRELAELDGTLVAGEVDAGEHARRRQEVTRRHLAEVRQDSREQWASVEKAARVANAVVPVGWLPLGVTAAAEGRPLPWVLGVAGMTLIGGAALRRAYRTAVGQGQGQLTNAGGRTAPARVADGRKAGPRLVEARIPGLSEPVSAVALATLRSLLRAPEVKMVMLTPLIMGVVFGSMLARGRGDIGEALRPLVATGGVVMVLFGVLPMMVNHFGFDRDGFRAFVLCAAPRRDVLLGKNLAYVPLAGVMAAVVLTAVEVVCPLRWDLALALVPQSVSMFLLFCVLANLCSIYAPVYLAPGSLNPANPKVTTVLLQLLMFLVLFPLSQSLALLPLGAEVLLRLLGRAEGLPVCLALSLAESAAVFLFYKVSLDLLGAQLQAREQRILEVVTNRAA